MQRCKAEGSYQTVRLLVEEFTNEWHKAKQCSTDWSQWCMNSIWDKHVICKTSYQCGKTRAEDERENTGLFISMDDHSYWE